MMITSSWILWCIWWYKLMLYKGGVASLTACVDSMSLMEWSYCSARMASLRVCSSFSRFSTALWSDLGVFSSRWLRRALYWRVWILQVSWNWRFIWSSLDWRREKRHGSSWAKELLRFWEWRTVMASLEHLCWVRLFRNNLKFKLLKISINRHFCISFLAFNLICLLNTETGEEFSTLPSFLFIRSLEAEQLFQVKNSFT